MPNYHQAHQLAGQQRRFRWFMSLAACFFAVIFLALGTWVVRGVEDDQLLRSARTYAKAIDSFRAFYTDVIVTPLVGHPWVEVTEHYRDQPGSIPIPATMTLDLAEFMSQRDETIDTRLLSDFPFPQRADRLLTEFDQQALAMMREAGRDEYYRFEMQAGGKALIFATPIRMQPTCTACHNNHPDSPRRDWQVGDVLGIQVVTLPVSQSVLAKSDRFLYLIVFVFLTFVAALLALFFMDTRVRNIVDLLFERNRELEAATKELKQQQNALDQHAIVSMTDTDGNITYTNQHFRSISGYSDAELIGRNHRIINSGFHPPEMFEQLWQTITSGGVWHGEIKNINKAGDDYWVKATIMPLYDAAGQIDRFISIRTDITQQKQLEQDLKSSNEELYALNATLDEARQAAEAASEAKSAFLANMSHEIRTPMTGIIGMTELALDTELTATQRGYLGVVKSSADALLSILNDILDFSKIDAGKLAISPVETDLKALLTQCLKPAAVLARKKGVSLVLELPEIVPDYACVDPVRLRQVLVNICDNAIKFTAEGRVKVSIGWQTGTGDGKGILCLHVYDQGIGIPESQQAHIFDAFSQADSSTTRQFGGTGLGLAITSRLVELMQGRIGLESSVGQGSHFWVELPCEQGRFDQTLYPDQEKTLWLLDTVAENMRTLSGFLRRLGYTCECFTDPDVLLSQSKSAFSEPRSYLIQHHLNAEYTGIQVIEQLLEYGVLPENCMLISDASSSVLQQQLQSLQIDRLLTHPPAPVEIQQMLQKQPATAAERACHMEQSGLQILLVEDNKVNQRLISTLLQKRHHQVTLAEHGKQAIELCQQRSFDLVLMDMQMPVMGGVEATTKIRELEARQGRAVMPIYAMTANVLPADKEACLKAGMNGHLGKPVKLTELDAVLETVKRFAVT